MKKQIRWLLIALLLLSLVLVACGGANEEPAANTNTAVTDNTTEETADTAPEPTAVPEEPEATAEPEPTAVPEEPTAAPEPTAVPEEPTAAPEVMEEEESIDLGSVLQGLTLSSADDAATDTAVNSYAYELIMTFNTTDESGAEVTQSVNMSVAYSNDPPAANIIMLAEGVDGADEFGQITMAQTGDTVYMVIPELGCITQTTADMDLLSDGNPLGDTFSPETLFEEFDISEAKRVRPDEEINGIEVEHYTFDETAIDDPESEVKEVNGDVYIAKDGGYLVRMVVSGIGQFEGFDGDTPSDGAVSFEYNLTSYNEPIEVLIPTECENAGAAVDLPMVDDAYEVTSFAGFVSYKSDIAFDEIIAFYEGVLADAGWVKDEDASYSFSGTASMSYTKEQETLTVMISQETDGGPQSVMLITEESE